MEFGYSDYYIIGEVITCWGAFLICLNTLMSYVLYDKQQRFFLYAASSTFFTSLFNIISVNNISHFSERPIFLCVFITSIYFFLLLICPFVMTTYVCDLAIQNKKRKRVLNLILVIVQNFYFLFHLLYQ